jgi:hypothetical protein
MRLKITITVAAFFLLSHFAIGQNISISEPLKEDSRDMNFEIVGKVSGNLLIFKDVRYRYAVNVYNDSMKLRESGTGFFTQQSI